MLYTANTTTMSETGNSRMFRKNDVTLAAKSSSNLSSEAIDNCNGDNNDLVAMFQCGDNNRQMIQLTPAQAAALGLTFEEDSEEPYDEVKYSNNNQDLIANLRDNLESNEPRGSNFWNSQSEVSNWSIDNKFFLKTNGNFVFSRSGKYSAPQRKICKEKTGMILRHRVILKIPWRLTRLWTIQSTTGCSEHRQRFVRQWRIPFAATTAHR